MKSVLLVVVGIVIGALASLVLGPVMLGVGAGVGIATGVKAGACLTVEAAKEQGYITSAQVDEVLKAAGQTISKTHSKVDSSASLTDAECQKLIDEVRASAE